MAQQGKTSHLSPARTEVSGPTPTKFTLQVKATIPQAGSLETKPKNPQESLKELQRTFSLPFSFLHPCPDNSGSSQ